MARMMTGLDISTSCVRAAELAYTDDGFELQRFAQMPLPMGAVMDGEVKDPRAVGEAISHMWREAKFRGRRVSIGVANQRVAVRMISIPYVPPQERRKSLPLLVGDQVPMPVDQAVLDFVPLETLEPPEGAPLTRGLLVAAAEESVLNAIAAAEAGGLEVADVDLTPFAVVRALCHADPLGMNGTHSEAIIDVGAATTVVVIHVNGIPHFVRILLMGGQDVTDRLMAELGVNLPTAESLKRETQLDSSGTVASAESPGEIMSDVVTQLVDELRGSLDYFIAIGSAPPLRGIVITGGGSLVPGFPERLETATGLPVSRGHALLNLGSGNSGLAPEHIAFADPMSAAAVGLAVRVDA